MVNNNNNNNNNTNNNNAVALGAISTGFEKYTAAIRIEMRVQHAQKTASLGTARILRLVLGC